jgi:uncharacterized protein (UPF0332 family)
LKPETADALEHAKQHLALARRASEFSASMSGREGYLAALTAGRGLTFELLDKGPKTHKGVKALIHALVKDGLEIDLRLLAIFDEGFDLKVTADYGDPRDVNALQAQQTIDMAEAFVARVEQILKDRG